MFSSGFDGPGIAQLLHAAFLIGQQISVGQTLHEAFLSSCCDVYVKPYTRRVMGNLGFLSFKQNLYDVLKKTLEGNLVVKEEFKNPLENKLLDSVTLSVYRTKENSLFANMKQQGSLLKAAFEAITEHEGIEYCGVGDIIRREKSLNTEFFTGLFGLEGKYSSEVKIFDIIPHFMLMFFEHATPNDLELRHEWLTKVISKCKEKTKDPQIVNVFNSSLKISETLRDLILHTSPALNEHKNLIKHLCQIDDLPWDIRWLPSVAVLCRHTNQLKCSMCVTTNKLSLLLYFRTKIIELKTLKEKFCAEERNSLTVENYSTALLDGKLENLRFPSLFYKVNILEVSTIRLCLSNFIFSRLKVFSFVHMEEYVLTKFIYFLFHIYIYIYIYIFDESVPCKLTDCTRVSLYIYI